MNRMKISLSALGEVLTPQEMKNITGGSIMCDCDCGYGEITTGECSGPTPEECNTYNCAGCGQAFNCRYTK